MLSECQACCGTGYQDQSTRCYTCNGKGFRLEISAYDVTQVTDEALDNINSTQPQAGRIRKEPMKPYTIQPHELARIFNLYRDLGALLDCIQPGLVYDPHSDADSADAQILINLADFIKREEV